MTPNIARNTARFLERTTMSAKEVPAYLECMQALAAIVEAVTSAPAEAEVHKGELYEAELDGDSAH